VERTLMRGRQTVSGGGGSRDRGGARYTMGGNLNPRPPRYRRPGDELRSLEQVIGIVLLIPTPH